MLISFLNRYILFQCTSVSWQRFSQVLDPLSGRKRASLHDLWLLCFPLNWYVCKWVSSGVRWMRTVRKLSIQLTRLSWGRKWSGWEENMVFGSKTEATHRTSNSFKSIGQQQWCARRGAECSQTRTIQFCLFANHIRFTSKSDATNAPKWVEKTSEPN